MEKSKKPHHDATRFMKAEEDLRRALRVPAQTQDEILRKVVSKNKDTEFGVAHGFSSITTAKEYRAQVPAVSYDAFAPSVERMLAGESNVLLADEPVFFARTSGTSGTPKHIAYAKEVEGEYWSFVACALGALEREFPGAADRGMSILGQYDEDRSANGVVIGSAGGYSRKIFSGYQHFENMPMAISEEARYEIRYYAVLLVALGLDLKSLATVNPSTMLALFRKIEEFGQALVSDLRSGRCVSGPPGAEELLRSANYQATPRPDLADRLEGLLKGDGQFLPEQYWKDLTVFSTWQGGNTKHYLKPLADLCPNTVLRAAPSGSSEAALLVPLERTWTGGVPALQSTYFEFLPEGASADPDNFVPLAELEEGVGYRFCVTNHRALYRLLMSDIFFIEDRIEKVPVLRFSHRADVISSLTGEKITEGQVMDAVEAAQEATALAFRDFQVGAIWGQPPRYALLLEQDERSTPGELQVFLRHFETKLREKNVEYDSKRSSQRLEMPVLRELPQGELRRLMVGQGKRSDAQSKIPRLCRDLLNEIDMRVLAEHKVAD